MHFSCTSWHTQWRSARIQSSARLSMLKSQRVIAAGHRSEGMSKTPPPISLWAFIMKLWCSPHADTQSEETQKTKKGASALKICSRILKCVCCAKPLFEQLYFNRHLLAECLPSRQPGRISHFVIFRHSAKRRRLVQLSSEPKPSFSFPCISEG